MAEYRKMRKYFKSKEQYKRERARRKQVLELSEAGFSQREIAVRLGVSTKTVGRDLKKLDCYIKKITRMSEPKVEAILGEALGKFSIPDRYRFVARAISEGKDAQWRMMLDLIRGQGRKWIEPNKRSV